MKNLSIKKLIFLLFISLNAIAQDGKFSFSFSSPVTTSAGVYKNDSILVRTLWSCVKYNAGTYSKYWDGKDDMGATITSPSSTYKIKVVSNNVQYTWQGTIGNTSDSMTGATKHNGYYNCMNGLAFSSNGYGYFCNGYSEGKSSYSKLLTAQPQGRIDLYAKFSGRVITLTTEYVATDNVNVYWAGFDSYAPTNSMVHAIRCSDDANVTFSSGSNYKMLIGAVTLNAISFVNTSASRISGLTVQKTGNFLFVARAGLNQLQVINKTTGATVQKLSIQRARSLSIDASGNLWMVTGTGTLSKYTVNSNGTLGNAILTLQGLSDPLAVQVSADGQTLAVADGGTSDQVKFYSNSTGILSSTLGIAGGYFTDATVSNNKFYFHDANTTTDAVKMPFIAFQPDGSFWVNDPGNFRVQHYSGTKVFINRIMSLGASYNVYADPNNPSRVFVGPLEFAINYNATLSGSTGWALVKNWGANITNLYMKPYFEHPTTLSNGRTYAIIAKPGPRNNREVVEFPASGQLRFSNIYRSTGEIIAQDGAIQSINKGSIGGITKVYRYASTGFDALGNPTWAATPEVLATTPTLTINDPNDAITGNVITSTNKVFIWNPDVGQTSAIKYPGYHLGSIARGGNYWLAKTELATHASYQGPYPGPGRFDIGNQVKLGGGTLSVLGRNLITSYHGEFWKNAQTNKYNHYLDNGLAIGQFGVTRETATGNAPAMYGGNALTPNVVADPSSANSMYLYHGDEAAHSAVHRWKITGLNSITEQVITIAYPSLYNRPVVNYIDLMAGLPFDDSLKNNTAGWTRYPQLNCVNNVSTGTFNVNTSTFSYNPLTSNDVRVDFQSAVATTATVNRDLGINNVTNSWKVAGEIIYPAGNNANGIVAKQYIEVLDANGKTLATFYVDAPTVSSTTIYGNTAKLATSPDISTIQQAISTLLPFEISAVNGQVSFTYGTFPVVTTTIYDATGNWKTPKTLRVRNINNGASGPSRAQKVGVKDFKFYKDYVGTTPSNQAPLANAGADKAIVLPTNATNLNGVGTDPDGTTISSYVWLKISGPANGTITSANAATTSITGLVQGVYQFSLTVTDNNGAKGKDTVQVTVTAAAVNKVPLANAGVDKAIVLPTTTTSLAGTGTDLDGTISSYLWSKISGPASGTITTTNAATTSITGLVQGVYQFSFTVTDNNGAKGKDTVQVTVTATAASVNKVPLANAGADKLIVLPTNTTSLAGIGTDLDGKISSYAWLKISGPTNGTITSANAATATATGLVQGVYQFSFTVTDNNGAKGKDTVQVTVTATAASVNKVPLANAGVDKAIVLPTNTTSLTGTGTDLDGKISSYAWLKISGPASGTITSANAATTTATGLVQGVYQFSFTVTDNNGAKGKDTVQVTVTATAASVNKVPLANAGVDKAIVLPTNNTSLAGTGTDLDGKISSYLWSKISGPASGTITTTNAATTSITGLVQGVYQFSFTVTDNNGAKGKDTVQVTVTAIAAAVNKVPLANAGVDKAIVLPTNTTSLAGTGTDLDGTISNYAWSKISGPASGTITSANAANTTATGLVQGVYQFLLIVTDNNGAKGKDTVQVTVNAATNQAPLANAGADKLIVLPANTTSLNGSGSDLDGNISKYSWLKISGPTNGKIATPNSNSTLLSNLVKGVYKFELTVTDNKGAIGKDVVQVTVNAGVNVAPKANAGADQTLVLPINSTTLSGVGFDSDGVVSKYTWSRIAGPSSAKIIGANGSNARVNNLVQGVYGFELSVIDNNGATGKDTVNITVGAVGSKALIASTSTRVVNSSTLTAFVNDMKVYPNPVVDITNLNVSTIAGNKLFISVVDFSGRTVLNKEHTTLSNKSIIPLNLSSLQNGSYLVIVRFADGQRLSSNIIKVGR